MHKELLTLGYYQIIGGVIGLALAVWFISTTDIVAGWLLFSIIFFLALYTFSILSGWKLLKGDFKNGLRYSMINQILQTIHFSGLGFTFKYVSGIMLMVGLDVSDGFKLLFDISITNFKMDINSDSSTLMIGFNVFAIVIVYLVGKLQEQVASVTPVGDEGVK